MTIGTIWQLHSKQTGRLGTLLVTDVLVPSRGYQKRSQSGIAVFLNQHRVL